MFCESFSYASQLAVASLYMLLVRQPAILPTTTNSKAARSTPETCTRRREQSLSTSLSHMNPIITHWHRDYIFIAHCKALSLITWLYLPSIFFTHIIVYAQYFISPITHLDFLLHCLLCILLWTVSWTEIVYSVYGTVCVTLWCYQLLLVNALPVDYDIWCRSFGVTY